MSILYSFEEVLAHAIAGDPSARSTRRFRRRTVWRARVERSSRYALAALAGLLCFVYLQGTSIPLFSSETGSNLKGCSEASVLIVHFVQPSQPESLLTHALAVLLLSALLSYFIIPSSSNSSRLNLGLRRLWICSAITLIAHLTSFGLMLSQWVRWKNELRDTDRDIETGTTGLGSAIGSVNWNAFCKNPSLSLSKNQWPSSSVANPIRIR